MPTAPATPDKPTPQPLSTDSTARRPETLQYELDKHEAAALAAAMTGQTSRALAIPGSSPQQRPASAPPPPPPADPDKWGMSTLVGQAAAATPAAPTPPKPDVGKDLERGATQLAGALGSGFRAASRSLAESGPGALEALLPGAPSPELVGADPLLALSTRLAAESDFWRRLGLQSLSRAIVADRVGYVVTALGVLSGLGLTVVAGFGGLFGGEHAAGKSALLGVGALIVLCAGAIAFMFTHVIRRGQRNAANAAFARADRAEQRLERLAVAAALRESEPDAFRAALLRITNDSRS